MNNEPVRKQNDDNFKELTPKNGENSGNIWGWRNSMIGGAIILAFLILVIVRYCQVKPDTFYVRESMHLHQNFDK
jgi:hypothetical protein